MSKYYECAVHTYRSVARRATCRGTAPLQQGAEAVEEVSARILAPTYSPNYNIIFSPLALLDDTLIH